MPTKYNRQRHIRTQMIGQKPGSISVPNKTETMAQITEKLNNADGIHITGKNFDFNKNGLTIANEGFSMQNLLDEEGMEVTRDGEGILSATKDGVNAIDLTARQYLIVGKNARFEDYGTGRTACFWIGG